MNLSESNAYEDAGDGEEGLGMLRPMKLEAAGETKRHGCTDCTLAFPFRAPRSALVLCALVAAVLTLVGLYQLESGFVYTLGQCLWRTYASVDDYSKSGTVYDSVTAVFTAQDSEHAGFFSAQLPTDKHTKHSYAEVYDRVRLAGRVVLRS